MSVFKMEDAFFWASQPLQNGLESLEEPEHDYIILSPFHLAGH